MFVEDSCIDSAKPGANFREKRRSELFEERAI